MLLVYPEPEGSAGWTYFIQPKRGGLIKIGFTSSEPRGRLAKLQTGSPVELQIIALLRGNQEQDLHKKFAKLRRHGEWFHPGKSLLTFISQECNSHVTSVI